MFAKKERGVKRFVTYAKAAFFATLLLGQGHYAYAAESASAFPSKPIRVINPHGPGGGTDIVIRAIASRLQEMWGQPVVVENRPGANTAIGIEAAASAPADGYTLAMCTQASHGSNPAVYPKLRYNALGDFTPIVVLNDLTMFLIVRSDSPYQSLQDLIKAAQAKPGALTYGSVGVGSLHHLAGELLSERTGTRMLHVPYTAIGNLITGLLGGQIDITFHSTPLPLVQSGRVRVLGVTTKDRWPIAPEYPTLIEQGIADYEVRGWFAVCARAGTPEPILEKMNQAINAILKEAPMLKIMRDAGLRPMGGTLQQAHDVVSREIKFWHDFVERSPSVRQAN